mgnify:CR=1 FL=1
MKVYEVIGDWEDTDGKLFINKEDAEKWAKLFGGLPQEKELWGDDAMNKGFYYCIKVSANFDFLRHSRTEWKGTVTRISYEEYLPHHSKKEEYAIEATSFDDVKISATVFCARDERMPQKLIDSPYVSYDVADELYETFLRDPERLMEMMPMTVNSRWDIML